MLPTHKADVTSKSDAERSKFQPTLRKAEADSDANLGMVAGESFRVRWERFCSLKLATEPTVLS